MSGFLDTLPPHARFLVGAALFLLGGGGFGWAAARWHRAGAVEAAGDAGYEEGREDMARELAGWAAGDERDGAERGSDDTASWDSGSLEGERLVGRVIDAPDAGRSRSLLGADDLGGDSGAGWHPTAQLAAWAGQPPAIYNYPDTPDDADDPAWFTDGVAAARYLASWRAEWMADAARVDELLAGVA